MKVAFLYNGVECIGVCRNGWVYGVNPNGVFISYDVNNPDISDIKPLAEKFK